MYLLHPLPSATIVCDDKMWRDMHLSTFYHHIKLFQRVMDEVNTYKPDLILNTGDFVSYGWREFESDDTILSKARSKYGNFAIIGNHDVGTYDPVSYTHLRA